jgi:endonuclease YncB( thermonuclease family)
MLNFSMYFISIVFFSFLITSQVHAHGGGLDKLDCHHNRKAGGYHCHQGPLAGQHFQSKADTTNALVPYSNDLVGIPRIVDGDTIWISETKIRLHGIDAPETKQECSRVDGSPYLCGEASTDALRVLVGSEPVHCEGDTYDRYKRLIAVCYSGTVNLNAELVRQGWALAYRRYSNDYISAEEEAQAAKRGMWAGEFEPPWKWRRK